jgi:aminoglycoside phosphotransferase (APT) family kinase protein
MDKTNWKEPIETYLSDRWKTKIQISNWKELSGGACQDNIAIDTLSPALDENKNLRTISSQHSSLVLRTDKAASLLSSLPKKAEFEVALEIFHAGAKTPEPILFERDEKIIGSPFYLMQRISGNANARFLVKDASINAYRKEGLARDLAINLSKIHSVRPNQTKYLSDTTLPFLGGTSEKSYIQESVLALRKTLSEIPEPHPAIELALNWLDDQAEHFVPDRMVLVHGDFRTGNFMVSPSGLEGILDFEFAHWGDRHEDVAWLCMRDWRFGKVNKEVGGFADRKEFYDEYEKASGIGLDAKKVTFWEIVGNLRWAIGSIQQAYRHLSGKDKGIELAAIGRRTSEMEYEALRLIHAR